MKNVFITSGPEIEFKKYFERKIVNCVTQGDALYSLCESARP